MSELDRSTENLVKGAAADHVLSANNVEDLQMLAPLQNRCAYILPRAIVTLTPVLQVDGRPVLLSSQMLYQLCAREPAY